jgi:LPXTG-motif cell wall-anchored protein
MSDSRREGDVTGALGRDTLASMSYARSLGTITFSPGVARAVLAQRSAADSAVVPQSDDGWTTYAMVGGGAVAVALIGVLVWKKRRRV